MRQRPARKITRTTAALMGVAGMLALAACGGDQGTDEAGTTPEGPAPGVTTLSPGATEGAETNGAAAGGDFTATLQDADGGEVGTAQISETEGALEFQVEASGMDPGFYGFHVHAIGECEPDSAAPDDPSDTGAFLSAGSHIGAGDSEHPDHPGDLPSLLVQDSGDAYLVFRTDRLTAEDFQDDDGAALMVHSDPDNFANIPDRYAADGPDEDTTGTGDAGSRLACGTIEAGA